MTKIKLIFQAVIRWIKIGEFKTCDVNFDFMDKELLYLHITRTLTYDNFIPTSFDNKLFYLCKTYLIQELKEDFVTFLEEEKIKDLFIQHLMSKEGTKWRENCGKIKALSFDTYLNSQLPQKYLLDAYLWARTAEGDTFWRNLNSKWFKAIEKNLNSEKYKEDTSVYNPTHNHTISSLC